jgi:predicted Na+-dependent transporter/outer membrane lipoprotein-sorting protein
VAVWLTTALCFRSAVAGILALVPVALAILVTYAVMGFAGIWLGMGTSMAAAIAVGLAVDFSVHVLSRLIQLVREEERPMDEALDVLFVSTGRALVFNVAAVVLGFGVLMVSKVPSLMQFGTLVGICVATGCVASLTVLPALVCLARPRFLELPSVRQATRMMHAAGAVAIGCGGALLAPVSAHAAGGDASLATMQAVEVAQAVQTLQTGAVGLLVVTMMLAMGLRLTVADILAVQRRPDAFRWGLVANLVLVPTIGAALCRVLDLPPGVGAGLVLCAAVPGGPMGPLLASLAGADLGFSIGLMAVLSLVSTVSAPLTLSLLLPEAAGRGIVDTFAALMAMVLAFQLAPLVVGLGLRRWRPLLADRLAQPFSVTANTLLAAVVAALLVTKGHLLTTMGWQSVGAMAVVVGASLLAGRALVGHPESTARALGLCTAVRNLSLALLLAAAYFPEPSTDAAILSFGLLMLVGPAIVAARWARADALTRSRSTRRGRSSSASAASSTNCANPGDSDDSNGFGGVATPGRPASAAKPDLRIVRGVRRVSHGLTAAPPYLIGTLLALLAPAATQASEEAAVPSPSGDEIVARINARDDGQAVAQHTVMELVDRRGKTRTYETRIFRKYDGKERRLALFFGWPPNVKGAAFLTYDRPAAGRDDQWLYLPATRRVRRVSAANRGDYFMGTDFTYDDMKNGSKVAAHDYAWTAAGVESVDGHRCHVVDATPVSAEVAEELGYGRGRLWVDAEIWMVRQARLWDVAGNRLKTIRTEDIRQVQGIWTAHRLEVDNHKTGHRTRFVISDVSYEDGVDDELFTERALRRGNQVW